MVSFVSFASFASFVSFVNQKRLPSSAYCLIKYSRYVWPETNVLNTWWMYVYACICVYIRKCVHIMNWTANYVRHYVTTDIWQLRKVHFSIFYAIMRYGLQVLGQKQSTTLCDIERLQNKAVKKMCFKSK